VAQGSRVRLEQRPKNLKPLLERAAADGYTHFAAVRPGATIETLEIKPLG
jgi:histidyl-tRNA synthetase